MSELSLGLSGEEADLLEWALKTVRPRTDREDEVRWDIHERLFELRPDASDAATRQ